jgi:hypothetical protein
MIIACEGPETAVVFWCPALHYRVTDRDETGVAIAGHASAPTILLIKATGPSGCSP